MTAYFSLTFLAPVVLAIAASFAAMRPGRRPGAVPRLAEWAALVALALGAAGVVQAIVTGTATFLWFDGLGAIGLRADAIGVTMVLLVSFIGWVVMRYARTYLDGEAREGAFHAQMLAALAAVLVFAQSATLATLVISTAIVGIFLGRLLLFYGERAEAQRAATKFRLVWHAGDLALFAGAILLYSVHGTAEFEPLANASPASDLSGLGHAGAGLIVLAAALKTAAFPLHGWLTEVMEAPTPVSALLHAGIINSGGVLLITLAGLVQQSPGAMAALVMLGGFTALFGATVMLTQSAIKTSLAWSTVSQMGFMLLQCGLGLWTLALLHIVAHSLYKAHAFLSAGGAVNAVAALRRPGPVAVPSLGAVLRSFALALLIFALIATLSQALLGPKTAQALALGAILIFGVAYLVAQGLADRAPVALTKRTVFASLCAAVAYFTFQAIAEAVWGSSLPEPPIPGQLEWGLITLALLSFGLVAIAQALFPLWAHHPSTAGLRVHLANGLYLNALLDRAIGGFRTTRILRGDQ